MRLAIAVLWLSLRAAFQVELLRGRWSQHRNQVCQCQNELVCAAHQLKGAWDVAAPYSRCRSVQPDDPKQAALGLLMQSTCTSEPVTACALFPAKPQTPNARTISLAQVIALNRPRYGGLFSAEPCHPNAHPSHIPRLLQACAQALVLALITDTRAEWHAHLQLVW